MSRNTHVSSQTPWAWACAGVLVGAVLATLVFAPARWLSAVLNQASGGRTLLEDARGTLWNGSATLTLSGGAGSQDAATLPSRLIWRLRPGASGITLALTAPCCLQQPWVWQVQPRWGGGSVRMSDAPSTWPAELLSGLGTPFNTLALSGKLALQPSALHISWVAGRLQLAGQLALQMQDISSRMSTLQPLGSYQLNLVGGATPNLQLTTLSGPLQLSGSGQWVGGHLRFTGEATANAEYQVALANLLNIIGRRSGARAIIKLG